MNFKTQNFTVEEIIHDPRYFKDLTSEELFCAGLLAGTLETLRDYLTYTVGFTIGITITSGLRRLEHNIRLYKELYPNQDLPKAAFTSNHIFRVEKNLVRCACDVKTIGYPPFKAFGLLKSWWTGELYYNKKEDIIHIGYQGKTIKQPWIT